MATSAARWNSCLKYVTQSRRVYFLNSLLADGGFGPLSSGDRQPEDHRQQVKQRIETMISYSPARVSRTAYSSSTSLRSPSA